MDFDFLTVMAYLVVAITMITMIFGIIAYMVYKMREAKRARLKDTIHPQDANKTAQKEKYLFFEEKELIL